MHPAGHAAACCGIRDLVSAYSSGRSTTWGLTMQRAVEMIEPMRSMVVSMRRRVPLVSATSGVTWGMRDAVQRAQGKQWKGGIGEAKCASVMAAMRPQPASNIPRRRTTAPAPTPLTCWQPRSSSSQC